MHADGIDIFHVADGDTVSRGITHHLVFYLLPAGYAPFDQNLMHARKPKTVRKYLSKLILIVRYAPAASA